MVQGEIGKSGIADHIWKEKGNHLLYSHLHHHSASQRHNIKDRRMNTRRMIKTQEGRHKKTSLEKYSPLTLLQGFNRVVQGLHLRGCWRPNINFIFWPPLLMTVTLCLSCSLRCSTRGLGVHCWMLAFFTASYQHLLWTSVHQGFKPHRPVVAFLTTSRLWLSGSLLATALAPNSTQLYNNSGTMGPSPCPIS